MYETIKQYIQEFNRQSQVTIEYAFVKESRTQSENITYDLYIIVAPTFDFISNYFGGNGGTNWPQYILNYQSLYSFLLAFPCKASQKIYQLPDNIPIETVHVSNLAMFQQIERLTEHGLTILASLYLDLGTVVYSTELFEATFLNLVESKNPPVTFFLRSIRNLLTNFLIERKKQVGIKPYDELLTFIIRLLFICNEYNKTGIFQGTISKTHENILDALKQAGNPSEYLQKCIEDISSYLQQPNISELCESERAAFTLKCHDYIKTKLIGELSDAS